MRDLVPYAPPQIDEVMDMLPPDSNHPVLRNFFVWFTTEWSWAVKVADTSIYDVKLIAEETGFLIHARHFHPICQKVFETKMQIPFADFFYARYPGFLASRVSEAEIELKNKIPEVSL